MRVSRARIAKPKLQVEPISINANKIFVGGIPFQATSREFVQYFVQFGKVKNFLFPPDLKNKNLNCGYGFITYFDIESVKNVIFAKFKHFLRAKEVFLIA